MTRVYLTFFFFNDTATTEIYTLSLHDALPIYPAFSTAGRGFGRAADGRIPGPLWVKMLYSALNLSLRSRSEHRGRSEEHTSELQSRQYLVCRLLLEKKNENNYSR